MPPSQVQALLRQCNPYAPLVRGTRSALLRAGDELLPSPAERQRRLAETAGLRRWGASPPPSTAAAAAGPSGPMQALLVSFKGELDVGVLGCATLVACSGGLDMQDRELSLSADRVINQLSPQAIQLCITAR